MILTILTALTCLIIGFALCLLVVFRSNGLVQRLSNVTGTLERTLGSPSEKGSWGEIKLRQVVELAGMEEWCDFSEQVVLPGGVGRPDMVVRMPGGRRVIVDSKSTFDTNSLRARVQELAGKRYWETLSGSLDFVVLFTPLESALGAALQQDPALLGEAARLNVILATPATLVAILRFIADGWRLETLTRSAMLVQRNGEEMYSRSGTVLAFMAKFGKSLGQAVTAYNGLVGSVEGRWLVSARRMHELGIGPQELEPVAPIDATVRGFKPTTTALMVGEQDRVEESDEGRDDGTEIAALPG